MCGRYVSPDDAAIEREFNLVRSTGMDIRASYNVVPSFDVPVIRNVNGVRQLSLMRWGLVPFFAKGVPGKYGTHIARSETITSKASYREPSNRGQRCIMPMLGFYEWQIVAGSKSKQPYHIRSADQEVFGLAAIWDASRREDGIVVESCAIITVPANSMLAKIHNIEEPRMPVMLSRGDYDTWLSGSVAEAAALIKQYPEESLLAWPVSTRVSKPENNDATLIEALNS